MIVLIRKTYLEENKDKREYSLKVFEKSAYNQENIKNFERYLRIAK